MSNSSTQNLVPERIASRCPCCDGVDLSRSPAVLMPFVADRVFQWKPARIDASWGLQTLQHGWAYSICNSLYCRTCSFLFLDIRFSDAEMGRLYGGYRDTAYCELREHYEPGYTARNESLNAGIGYIADIEAFLTPHLSMPPRILDWGGDTGKNTPFQQQHASWDIFDISDKPVIAGARRVTREALADQRYDLIVCSNVLEHIPAPASLLCDIVQAMDSDTVLYLEVPYEEVVRAHGANADLADKKRHWHEHINFFSESALVQLIRRAGLRVLNMRPLRASSGANTSYQFQIACKKIE